MDMENNPPPPCLGQNTAPYSSQEMINMNRKVWTKPTIEVAQINAAQAGMFSSTDNKATHKS